MLFSIRLSNDEVKSQDVFKEVYMSRATKKSYFELLKLRRVEIYYRNMYAANKLLKGDIENQDILKDLTTGIQ